MVKVGDIINLTDIQTLEDLMDEGKSISTGLELTVSDVRIVNHSGVEWQIYSFDEQDLVVIQKSVPGLNSSLWYVYFPAEGFTSGSREEIVENGCNWIFSEPENPNWSYDDLKYAQSIESGDGDFIKYVEIYGHDNNVYAIVEWECENKECRNPMLIALEVGNYIKVLQGVLVVDDSDVQVYNRS